jgi:hypothetical protein
MLEYYPVHTIRSIPWFVRFVILTAPSETVGLGYCSSVPVNVKTEELT